MVHDHDADRKAAQQVESEVALTLLVVVPVGDALAEARETHPARAADGGRLAVDRVLDCTFRMGQHKLGCLLSPVPVGQPPVE